VIRHASYLRHKPERCEADRQWRHNNQVSALVISARKRAKKKGFEFSISSEDLEIPDVCPILGVKLVRKSRYAPSIDRKDSAVGYVPGNVWVVSRVANTMKNDATITELKAFGKWANELIQS
jgi:hypothetical protein